jgi:hypothetical protein
MIFQSARRIEHSIGFLDTKTLDIRRLCTDRRQDVAVIFSFGLDILFTRDSRAHSSAVLSLLYYWLLLALTVI